MKLVKAVEHHNQFCEFVSHKVRSPGRIRFSSCVIDFGEKKFILGEKIEKIRFGKHVYEGVLPLKNDSGSTVVECWVDNVTEE